MDAIVFRSGQAAIKGLFVRAMQGQEIRLSVACRGAPWTDSQSWCHDMLLCQLGACQMNWFDRAKNTINFMWV